MSLYYFLASLPALTLGTPPPVKLVEFLTDAARLTPTDIQTELSALLEPDPARARTSFAAQWFDAQTQIRNAIAYTRAARRSVDVAPYVRATRNLSVFIRESVLAAYSKPHPLEREMALDRLRWNLAEDLARGAPFGPEAVLAYGLKVQMAERWEALTDPAGRAALLQTIQRVRDRLSPRTQAA